MKNFDKEQIEFLINNYFLMDAKIDYGIYPLVSQLSRTSVQIIDNNIAGSPVIISTEEFKKFNPYFPTGLLENFEISQWSNKTVQGYVIPKGLQYLSSFHHSTNELTPILNKWNKLVGDYIKAVKGFKNQTEYKNLHIELIETYKEIYLLCKTSEFTKKQFIDEELYNGYNAGILYRKILEKTIPEKYKLLAPEEQANTIISSTFSDIEDLRKFEKKIIESYNYGYLNTNRKCDMYVDLIPVWQKISSDINKTEKSNDNESHFLKSCRDYLYNPRLKRRSGDRVIEYLEALDYFDFNAVKEDYIYFYNASNKKNVAKYLHKILEANNALPEKNAELLLEENAYIIYAKSLAINFDTLKQHINGNVYGAETLMHIVYKSFTENEKELKELKFDIEPQLGKVNFVVQTLDEKSTSILSQKLMSYVKAVLSESFLTTENIKTLSNNGINRRSYENRDDVMKQYNAIKDKFVLKEQFDKKLIEKESSKKTVKKI